MKHNDISVASCPMILFLVSGADDPFVEITGLFNNLYLRIEDNQPEFYDNDSGWKMLIHDERDSPLISIRTHGTTLYRGWAKDIRISIRQVTNP